MQPVSSAKIKEKTAVFCARYLPWLVVVAIFAYTVWLERIDIFFSAVAAGVVGRGLNEAVHLFYKKKRPAQLDPNVKTLVPSPKNLSFPSGHASFMFGISFFILLISLPAGITLLLLSAIIGVARVYCRVHWWQDIAGSLVVGLIAATATQILLGI